MEIPRTLDVRLIMLVSETKQLLLASPVSALGVLCFCFGLVFFQGTVASKGPDYQVSVISSNWSII